MRCDEPQLIHGLRLPGGERVTVRPVCPQDAGVLQTYVRALSPDARYKRFFGPLRELPPVELDRVIHLDPPNQLGLIAQTRADGVIGEARYALSPDELDRSEEHTSELQSRLHLVCRLLLEKKKPKKILFIKTIKQERYNNKTR